MARKSRTQQITEGILGQHIALSVAAHLARTQLVPDPLSVYDGQHVTDMVVVVANALARVAPLYVQDTKSGAPRQLTDFELEGGVVKRGATVLCLRDGRTLSSVSMKRADLRQAIGILKTVGIPGLARSSPQPAKPPPAPDRFAELAMLVAEIEKLLRPPLLPEQFDEANRLLVALARQAPQGRVANIAMRLMSAVQDARPDGADGAQIRALVGRLRAAVEEAAQARP